MKEKLKSLGALHTHTHTHTHTGALKNNKRGKIELNRVGIKRERLEIANIKLATERKSLNKNNAKVAIKRDSLNKNRLELARESGITLIALIITIIVLLVLAGISISMLTGNNSIIKNAQQAKIETEKAELEEKIKLAIMGAYDSTGSFNVEQLKTELDGLGATYSETENELLIDMPNGKQMTVAKGEEKKETTYTLNYDANEGTVTPTSITAAFGEAITMPTPTREGYTFNGWYTEKTGGTKVEYTTMPEKNETVYARWTAQGLIGQALNIGQEVTVGEEQFFVIEDSPASNDQVKLLAKYNLNQEGTAQQNAEYGVTSCIFSSSQYWTGANVDLNIDSAPEGSAYQKAKSYGLGKEGIGRLLTYDEASSLQSTMIEKLRGKRNRSRR